MSYVVIAGLAGALAMFAGDMLLYYTPEDFAMQLAVTNRSDFSRG